MSKSVLAWHWVKNDCTLCDGSALMWHEKLIHQGKLEICLSGYHASKNILDALKYAKGSIICRVYLSGNILKDTDKICAEERTVLWAIDAEQILFDFARWCASEVINLWDAPDIVKQFLKTGDKSLRAAALTAATTAAEAVAWDTAVDTAGAAVKAAVKAAANAAAWATARDAAEAAAWAASRDAALAADRAKQNEKLEELINAEWESQWSKE